jgi:hypothetical protein
VFTDTLARVLQRPSGDVQRDAGLLFDLLPSAKRALVAEPGIELFAPRLARGLSRPRRSRQRRDERAPRS